MNFKEILIDNHIISENDRSKQYSLIACPFHHEKNGKSLYINFDKNFFKCFGKCQIKGSLYNLIQRLFDSIISFDGMFEEAPVIQKDLKKIIEPQIIPSYKVEYRQKVNNSPCIPELENRGFSNSIIQANYIYKSNYNDRIYIPIFFKDNCWGYIKRSTQSPEQVMQELCKQEGIQYQENNLKEYEYLINEDESSPLYKHKEYCKKYRFFYKYLNDFNLPKSKLVAEPVTNKFCSQNLTIICEGYLDALKCNQFGFKSLAILGTGINASQINYIETNYSNIVLGFDNDPTGKKYTKQFRDISLVDYPYINLSLLNYNCKDIDNIKDKNDMLYLLNNLVYS